MRSKSGKACLILIFSACTNSESMAHRSFRSEEHSAGVVRKVITGIAGLRQPSVHGEAVFDPSMSALPIMKTQKSQVTDCSPANRERELGLDLRETG